MAESIADALRRAKALISDPKHWTKGALARDDHGSKCQVNSDTAFSFCSYGACRRVGGSYLLYPFLDLAAMKLFHRNDAVACNDSEFTTHELVMQMFDMAIAEAEALA